MPSYYSVVQYYPDPSADERINIGVVAYEGSVVRTRFLSEWSRVKHFGGENVDFLKDFAHRFHRTVAFQTSLATEAVTLGLPDVELPEPELTGASLEEIFREWSNSIRFTPPRASLHNPDGLLSEIVRRYLVLHRTTGTRHRDQRSASKIAVSGVRQGLMNSLSPEIAEGLVRRNYRVNGARQDHLFDVAIANGTPHLVAQSASFEVPDRQSKALHNRLDSIAWSLSDARPLDQGLAVGVLALPPEEGTPHEDEMQELYDSRVTLFKELGATILGEHDIAKWAAEIASHLPV